MSDRSGVVWAATVPNDRAARAAWAGMRAVSAVMPGVAARVAERLWCTPPRTPLSPTARATLAAAEPLTLAADGRRVAAYAWGDGPLVLLMHGWGGHAGQMAAFVAPLAAAAFRVLALDAPGHGRSPAGGTGASQATLWDFRWALWLAAARTGVPHAVIAHSVGATAAAWALADIDARPELLPGTPAFAPRRAVFVAPALSPADYAERFGRGLGLTPAVARRWQDRLAARVGFRWDDLDMRRAPERTRTPPLLVVHDRRDRFSPWRDGAALAACWPGARLHSTDGLGHRRLLDDPGVVERVVAFAGGPACEPAGGLAVRTAPTSGRRVEPHRICVTCSPTEAVRP